MTLQDMTTNEVIELSTERGTYYRAFTETSVIPETVYEQVAKLLGLANAGEVRKNCASSSGYDMAYQLYRHTFVYLD